MIIFLYGSDTYRSRQKLRELKGKFKREIDPAGNSLMTIDGESASLERINEVVSAPSLFSRKRMIVIEKIFSNSGKELFSAAAEYFKKFASAKEAADNQDTDRDNIIVFWDDTNGDKLSANPLFKFFSQIKFKENFQPLSNTQAVSWIRNEAKKRGVTVRQQAAVHLTSLFSGDLWQIKNEVNKLVNYKLGQTGQLVGGGEIIIEVADVDMLARGSYDENIFALTDAISNRNKSRAVELFENEIEAGVTESYLIHMIIRQFRILLQIRQGLDLGQTSRKIINRLKLHPYVVQKSMGQVRNFSLPVLKKIFSSLLEIDRRIKTGQSDLKTALDLLIAQI